MKGLSNKPFNIIKKHLRKRSNHFKSPENEIFETYTKLGCVNDDPDFLKIAAEWANPHIEAMLSAPKSQEHIQTRRLDFD
jgi:hypothetical protein